MVKKRSKTVKIIKNGQNHQKHVKKSISNTEYEPKNDKNHCGNPFSMVSIDSYTVLTTISNFEIWCPTLSYKQVNFNDVTLSKT